MATVKQPFIVIQPSGLLTNGDELHQSVNNLLPKTFTGILVIRVSDEMMNTTSVCFEFLFTLSSRTFYSISISSFDVFSVFFPSFSGRLKEQVWQAGNACMASCLMNTMFHPEKCNSIPTSSAITDSSSTLHSFHPTIQKCPKCANNLLSSLMKSAGQRWPHTGPGC